MIRRAFNLMVLAIILSSCAMNATKNYGEVNLHELHSNEKKYGVVVFRSIYLSNEDRVKKFVQDEHSINLSSYDEADVFAKMNVEDKHGLFYFGYHIGGNWLGSDEDEAKKKRFTIQKGKIGWTPSGTIPEIVMPEFFYTIKMLPEGKYYASRIQAGEYDGQFDKKDTPYYFYVKPGHINYLGDLFIFSPEKNGFWSSSYNLSTKLYNKSYKAEEFMKKYHPEINLPFITNLIISNNN